MCTTKRIIVQAFCDVDANNCISVNVCKKNQQDQFENNTSLALNQFMSFNRLQDLYAAKICHVTTKQF